MLRAWPLDRRPPVSQRPTYRDQAVDARHPASPDPPVPLRISPAIRFQCDVLCGIFFHNLWQIRSVDPSGGNASFQNDRFGVLDGEIEGLERPWVADAFSSASLEGAAQFICRQIGEVFEGLHTSFTERHRHRQRYALDFEHSVINAEIATLGVKLGGFTFKRFAGPSLKFNCRVVVESLDRVDGARFPDFPS